MEEGRGGQLKEVSFSIEKQEERSEIGREREGGKGRREKYKSVCGSLKMWRRRRRRRRREGGVHVSCT